MAARSIALSSRVLVSKDQVSCDLGGDAAILNLKTGVYFGLDPVAARIWALIPQTGRVHEIRDTILNEYEVEAGQCESDLLALLARLNEAGLIEVTA